MARRNFKDIDMTAAARISPALVLEQASVIVFGRDGNKARASWFPSDEADRAAVAADLMGMNTLKIANDDVRNLAVKMPKGRLFDSGKAFVPFVQMAVCEQLIGHLPEGQLPKLRVVASGAGGRGTYASASGKPGAAIPAHYPTDWSDIQVGSMVLATEGGDEGWFECIVQEAYEKEVRLKWRDFPDYEVFTRGRDQLALMWASPALTTTN